MTVRRKHLFSDKGKKLSWALVSFASEEGASKCVGADGMLVQGVRLKIKKLDDRTTTSTGAFGETQQRHTKKVDLLRRRGDIICETPGHSDEVGERCVAVRLHSDGRVILVRRSGVKEVDLPTNPGTAESGVNVARWGRGGVSVAKVRPKRLFTDAHASARFDVLRHVYGSPPRERGSTFGAPQSSHLGCAERALTRFPESTAAQRHLLWGQASAWLTASIRRSERLKVEEEDHRISRAMVPVSEVSHSPPPPSSLEQDEINSIFG